MTNRKYTNRRYLDALTRTDVNVCAMSQSPLKRTSRLMNVKK